MTGAPQTVVVTGASGRMGRELRPKLASPGRLLRLVDLAEADDAGSGAVDEEFVSASITDAAAMAEVCAGADAVIHLAGASAESDFGTVTQLNIHGTHNVLEAARQAGVARVVLASSHHVVGFAHRADVSQRLPASTPARPDNLYALSKAALETAGQLYADRFGMDVTCVRIGTFRPVPLTHRDLSKAAFVVLRVIGAVFLLYLGVKAWRSAWKYRRTAGSTAEHGGHCSPPAVCQGPADHEQDHRPGNHDQHKGCGGEREDEIRRHYPATLDQTDCAERRPRSCPASPR